jgi:hypothetical protein
VERTQRIGLIVVAVVIAAVGIVVISVGGDDDDSDSGSGQTATQQTETQARGPTGSVDAPTPKPKPEFQKVAIKAGNVQGGEQEIEVAKGDTAMIEVTSDEPDDIHLHGYDISKTVAPGKPARFRFKADLEGIFEIEAHHIGNVTIATLVVEP